MIYCHFLLNVPSKLTKLIVDENLICDLIPPGVYFIVVFKKFAMLLLSLLDALDKVSKITLQFLLID